jgi:hypothetical protein
VPVDESGPSAVRKWPPAVGLGLAVGVNGAFWAAVALTLFRF